jgi:hypothetical protein
MKRFVLLAVLSMMLVATHSYADEEGHMMDSGMMGSPGYGETAESGSESYGMMGYGMGSGMMNPGMMGYGGCGMMPPGMMGCGGSGMMKPGMMRHHQMMHGVGRSGMMGEISPEEQQKFLNNTVELRKQLMMKRFDYSEALRKSETKTDELKKIEKDMWEIQKKIADTWYE